MEASARQLSLTIESIAKTLAEWTVTALAERDPGLPGRYGGGWRGRWVGDVQVHLLHLAQAIAVGRPELFVVPMQLAAAAGRARSEPGTDLVESLRCLREVVEAELPAPASAAILATIDAAVDALETATLEIPTALRREGPHMRLVLAYLEALLDHRDPDARAIVIDAVVEGLSIADLYTHVLQPAQAEIGRMWHLDEITVADEHHATATTMTVMSLLRVHWPAVTSNGHRLVAATVPGDLHEVGLRMVSDLLELEGWAPLYLGANVPADDLVQAVLAFRASLLALSASTTLHVRSVAEVIERLRADGGGDVRVLVGGPPFNLVEGLWQSVGADGFAASAVDAVSQARGLR